MEGLVVSFLRSSFRYLAFWHSHPATAAAVCSQQHSGRTVSNNLGLVCFTSAHAQYIFCILGDIT
jgi:hypothetical protein